MISLNDEVKNWMFKSKKHRWKVGNKRQAQNKRIQFAALDNKVQGFVEHKTQEKRRGEKRTIKLLKNHMGISWYEQTLAGLAAYAPPHLIGLAMMWSLSIHRNKVQMNLKKPLMSSHATEQRLAFPRNQNWDAREPWVFKMCFSQISSIN